MEKISGYRCQNLNLGSSEEIIMLLPNVEFVQSPETKLNYQIWESKHEEVMFREKSIVNV